MQSKTLKPQPLDFGVHFDVTKHIRLVSNWNDICQISMENNLYDKPLAKSKLFPLESLRTLIGTSPQLGNIVAQIVPHLDAVSYARVTEQTTSL